MARFEGFVGPTYQTRGLNQNLERCINLVPEIGNPSSKAPIVYHNTPGLSAYITLANSPVRCLWPGEDRLFVVAGTKYGEIVHGSPPTFQDRGTLANDGFNANIYSNGSQLFVVSGGKAYYDNGGAASGANAVDISSIAAPNDGPSAVSWGGYLDGYFLALKANTNTVYISALLDGSLWPNTEFQSRISSHDRLVAIITEHARKLVWLFGRRNIDPWQNTGNADFPFEPVGGATIPAGTSHPHTIQALDDSLFFLGEDDRGGSSVFRTRGYALERISTHAVEQWLQYPNQNWCAWTVSDRGHQWYVLTNIAASGTSFTWVYDCASKLWFEWNYWNSGGATFDPHLARCHAYTTPGFGAGSGGNHYLGSRTTSGSHAGRVFKIEFNNVYTDAGDTIKFRRVAPHLASEDGKWNFYHRFALDVGITGTPTITLAWSDDDGSNYTAEKNYRQPLPSSNALKRLIWDRLGRSRDRVFRVTGTLDQGIELVDAWLNASPGES